MIGVVQMPVRRQFDTRCQRPSKPVTIPPL